MDIVVNVFAVLGFIYTVVVAVALLVLFFCVRADKRDARQASLSIDNLSCTPSAAEDAAVARARAML